MSFVTRVYEVVVTVEENFLNGGETDLAEREASRNECWEGIERDIQLSISSIYGSERDRSIKIWKPLQIENEMEHEEEEHEQS